MRTLREEDTTKSAESRQLGSEKGVVLVVVLVLSAVALIIMTTLIYMIMTGTQASGMQKRYKTAMEAAQGGSDVFYQVIALRGEDSGLQQFRTNINSFGLNFDYPVNSGCTGTASGTTYPGLKAKLLAPSSSWTNCSDTITINPTDPTTYDITAELGTTTKYKIYAKIVGATQGNSGGDEGLLNKGVVSANTGEVAVLGIPYLYTIEVSSENSAKPEERAKLSILYEY